MIYNYPYFGFPNYINYTTLPNSGRIINNQAKQSRYSNFYNKNTYSEKSIKKLVPFSENCNSTDYSNEKVDKSDNEKPFLDLLGIHLYFDDILILCVILFLYNEKTEDYYLLLSLILLLLG